ncbi:DUF2971 domain-containing protein [Kluyvera georgiana]|uniref:DUF2971 domain-containing protein n=1 Tax=Kluyvera georgiana TaxID=73098 RepID=UPI00321F8568
MKQAVLEAIQAKVTKENFEFLQKFHEFFLMSSPEPYICCFSSEDDLLSQWRSYANDGRGVSIGFNRAAMPFKHKQPSVGATKPEFLGIGEVFYKEKETLYKEISEYIDQVLLFETLPGMMRSEKMSEAVKYLHNESYYTKNNYFSEEKEIRVIHLPANFTNHEGIHMDAGSLSELNFRVTGNKITSYYEFDFSQIEQPIVEVVFGPKCELNSEQVKFLLDSNGLGKVKLRRSGASYQ